MNLKVHVAQKGGVQQCTFCHDQKLRGALRGCDGCGAIQHQECWDSNQGCATLGCAYNGKARPGAVTVCAPPQIPVMPVQNRLVVLRQHLAEIWAFCRRLRAWGSEFEREQLAGQMIVIGLLFTLSAPVLMVTDIPDHLYRSAQMSRGLAALVGVVALLCAAIHFRPRQDSQTALPMRYPRLSMFINNFVPTASMLLSAGLLGIVVSTVIDLNMKHHFLHGFRDWKMLSMFFFAGLASLLGGVYLRRR